MQNRQLTANDILVTFFLDRLDGEVGVRRKRIERVHTSFRDCIDEDVELRATREFRAVLRLERMLHPQDAALHLTGASDVLWWLVAFVLEEWAEPDTATRVEQLRMIDDLRNHIVYTGLVCVECVAHPLEHIRDGLVAARRDLKQRERERRLRNKARR